MRKDYKKLKRISLLLLPLIALLVIYFVAIPEYLASQYIARVHQAAATLEPGYRNLEESTGRTFISDPTIRSDNLTGEIESLRNLLRENRIDLDHFSSVAADYKPLTYTGFTDQAKTATILQNRAVGFARQSDDAFIQYAKLVDFIHRYDASVKTISNLTSEFNATEDLNVYAGRQSYMRDIAEQIRTEAKTLEDAVAPHEATAFKMASVESMQQLAAGFDTVALGLQIPADDTIYSGAREIEAVDKTINETNQTIYARDILSSRTIKSIQELREKLELITP